MSIRQLTAWRDLAGWLSALCFFLVLACIIDGVVAGGRKDPNVSEVLPGQSIYFSGTMPRDTEKLSDLYLRSSNPGIELRLDELYTGFWMGGKLWRAEATFHASLAPGQYMVSLSARNETSPKMTQFYTMRVFPSVEAVKDASLSLVTRQLRLSPFFLATCALTVGLLLAVTGTLLSQNLSNSLRSQGLGLIYRTMRTPEGQRIFFALGKKDGIAPGDPLEILDPAGVAVLGSTTVDQAHSRDSESLLAEGMRVPISALVRKPGRP